MTPREFFNAWKGYTDAKSDQMEAVRNIVYGAARWNGSATAFSKEQSKAVGNYKFPWEKGFGKKAKPMPAKQVIGILSLISKNG